jgi:VWFA-related protein
MTHPRTVATVLLAAALAASSAAPARAQQPEQARDASAQISATEVLLDLVVADKKGRPITDIRQDEVEVYENGARQTVTSFDLVRSAASTEALAEAAEKGPFAHSPLRGRNVIMIVIDRGSVQRSELSQVYRTVEKFINERLAVNDAVAVFGVTSRPILIQNFTNDKTKLLDAMKRVTAGTSVPLAEATDEALRVDLLNAQGTPVPDFGNVLANTARGVDTFSANLRDQIQTLGLVGCLKAIAKAAGTVRGRKTMILYSTGFVVTKETDGPFKAMLSDANRANLTINAVDAAGLDARVGGGEPLGQYTGRAGAAPGEGGEGRISVEEGESTLDRTTKSNLTNNDEALSRLATGTGGVLVRNTNDLSKGFSAIETGLRAYYALSYSPTADQLDGTYREISVKVRREGAVVRTRSGYYATGAETVEAAAAPAFERPILDMIAAPGEPPHALRVALKTERFRAGTGGWDVPVVISVDGADLASAGPPTEAAPAKFQVDAVAVLVDERGATVATASRSAVFRAELAQLDAFRAGRVPLVCFAARPLAPGRYTLKVGVYDPTSKRATVISRPIVVPELPADGAPALSSLVLGRALEPGEGAAGDPFMAGAATRVVPDAAVRFSKAGGDRVYAFFRLAALAPGSKYRMQLQVRRGEAVVAATPVTALEAADARGETSTVSTIALDAFEPGAYRVTLAVLPPEGATPVATTSAGFTVEP